MKRIIFPMFIESSKGGMQEIVLTLIDGLINAGYDCKMLTTKTSELVSSCSNRGIPCDTLRNTGGPVSILLLLGRFVRYILKNRNSLFIVNDIYTHVLMSMYFLPKKEIFVSHGGNYKERGKQFASNSGITFIIAKQYSFKRVSRFVAVSDSQRENLANNAKVKRSKITVIPNSIMPVRRAFIASNKTRLSMVGYIKPLKNQLEVLKSLSLLKEEGFDVCLNIFGSISNSEYFNQLETYIRENKLENDVKFWGYVDNKELIYSNTDILISASFHEGFGLTLVEAMSCGVPTIAYIGAEGPATIIKNKKNGILVERNSYECYSEAVKLYIQNKLLTEIICKEAALDYEAHYNIKNMVEKYKFEIESYT